MTIRNGKTRQRERLIYALLSASRIKDAAQAVGICERTALRWMAQPEFQVAYQTARNELLKRAKLKLQMFAEGAVDTLNEVRAGEGVAPGVKVMASSRLLELVLRVDETENLEQRIAKLEGKQ